MFRTLSLQTRQCTNRHMQLLETRASWSTSYMNHIFNQIFSDLTQNPNLPRMRNKA